MSDVRLLPLKYKAPCSGCRYVRLSEYVADCTYFEVHGWPEMPFINRYALDKTRPSLTTRKMIEGPFEETARVETCSFYDSVTDDLPRGKKAFRDGLTKLIMDPLPEVTAPFGDGSAMLDFPVIRAEYDEQLRKLRALAPGLLRAAGKDQS
jgi:hypothetical protein